MTDVRVNSFQAFISTMAVTVGTVYFPVAGIVIPMAGAAGWIAVLVAFTLAIPWALMAVSLSAQAPVGDWGRAVKAWLGPWVGRMFLLYMVVIWSWLGGMLLAQTGLVFHNIALPRTSPVVLNVALLVLVVLADLRGVEVYIRSVEAIFMITLPLVLGFLIVAVGSVRFENLQPLFGEAPIRIAHAVYMVLPWAMEGILFTLFVCTLVKDKHRLGLVSAVGILGAGASLSVLTILVLGVLGRSVTESYIYPTVALSQVVHIGFFLQGLEIFLYPLWVITSYVKVGASFLIVSESIRGIAAGAGQPYRSMVLGVIFYAISSIPANIPEMVAYVARVDNTFFMFAYGIIPLIWLWVRWSGNKEQMSNAGG